MTSQESYGSFTVTAMGGAGMTHRQASTHAFIAPSRGVRYASDHPDPATAERESALLVSRPDAVLSGATGADHWGLPLPPWIGLNEDEPITVAAPAGSAHAKRRGLRPQRVRLPDDHITTHRGLSVTTPARTWLDCAALMPIHHVIAMGDAVLHRGLATPDELTGIIHWAYRRRGVAVARQALPLLDGRAESPMESIVRAYAVLDGLPAPECNIDIYAGNRWIARVDMCWPDAMVIVEYDGAVHLTDEQRRRDARRRNELQEAGWLVITVTADDLKNPGAMIARIHRALQTRR